ncbi:epidermal growth factor-like protein 7 [Periophthalmus magnuspinnatus]|uniref:epidermal growth factor-like protein 7 n=1 Tax=Periophthalmus magnuspinnatus TaxID=409849 RepID=UPI00145B4663|nr:epidermal growth factor-like protein 7 [Periophthalmus magnuspinnatus]
MNQVLLLHSSLFIFHVMGTPQLHTHHGRRVCGQSSLYSHKIVMATQSYAHAAHRPYITLCNGHRLCSTYKTVYSTAYRVVTRLTPYSHFYPECCPGWKRLHSHNCNQAVCTHNCMNGGTCYKPNQCACPLGWRGHQCQTDVNECSEQRPCAHKCVNTAGSYRCECRDGFRLMGDGRSCQSLPSLPPPPLPPSPPQPAVGGHPHTDERLNLVENVTEEVQNLRNRVELLEKTLQMALTPYNSIFPLSGEEGLSEKTTLLSYSFQQLDRIDSLSEQIGFLEERLGTCSCQEDQQPSPIK